MTDSPVDSLRADLTAARFTVAELGTLWGEVAGGALYRGQRIPARRALDGRRSDARTSDARTSDAAAALATLARLFVLGDPVPVDDLERALPRLAIEGAVGLGLVAREGGSAVPLVDLRPYSFVDARGAGEWWIASDLGELALGHALPEDHVLGVGGASMTLSGLMLQAPVGSALDLGTGCGIQALHASRHADRVVATDISVRALELAAFNARLNEVAGIEFRLGSLFEPVAGERFDHIVSNPPFVITPRGDGVPEYEYRDGGMVGDALVEAVIEQVADVLAPGGVAQLLANWEYRGEGDAFDRVRGWLDTAGAADLDVWVIERDVQDAAEYAETWIRDGGTRPGTARFDELLSAWLDDFAARDVTSVGFGYVLVRRPEAGTPTLRRLERLHGSLGENEAGLGVHLGAALAAHDGQAATSDSELASSRLAVAPDVTEERHFWPGDEGPTAMLLRQGGGFGRTVQAGTALIALVGACDGDLTVGAICAAIAQLLEVDAAELTAELLPSVRGLIDDGFLLPVT
ncbi:DUF7059 domain-containing protein [Diaminobutyricibacter sp. McL0608]|uniref:DUF7059 domain-containing protein n=1 Tax=Leifsonia sp. McL0608 TaxID=3143537 RepID=UPI0031F2E870